MKGGVDPGAHLSKCFGGGKPYLLSNTVINYLPTHTIASQWVNTLGLVTME